MENGVEDGAGTFALERKISCAHFVENNSEREQVGACVQLFAENLLWRHVRDGAQSGARTGQLSGVHAHRGHGVGFAV